MVNLLIIYRSYPHLKSVHENIRKYVGIPNCLAMASTPYKNCFQYAGVRLAEFINENTLSFATILSIVSLKLLLTVPAMSVPGLIM